MGQLGICGHTFELHLPFGIAPIIVRSYEWSLRMEFYPQPEPKRAVDAQEGTERDIHF